MLVQAYFFLIQVSQLILQQNQEISIISLNLHPFSDRINITPKYSKIRNSLHIMVALTLFVRVRILLRLPPKKQLFVWKAAFFVTFCSLWNFQIFCICPFAPQFCQNMTICIRCDYITVMPLPVCRSVLSAGSAALSIKTAYVIAFRSHRQIFLPATQGYHRKTIESLCFRTKKVDEFWTFQRLIAEILCDTLL